MLLHKLKIAMFLVLTINSISCASVLLVRLELPNKTIYNKDIVNGIAVIKNAHGNLIGYTVSIETLSKLAENKIMCREYGDTLRRIIKITH